MTQSEKRCPILTVISSLTLIVSIHPGISSAQVSAPKTMIPRELSQIDNNSLLTEMIIGADEFKRYDINEKIMRREFKHFEVSDKIISYYPRRIGEIVVESNFLNYQFSKMSGKIVRRFVQWRDDLPSTPPPDLISMSEAERIVRALEPGTIVHRSKLYYISNNSVIYRVSPKPKNPCWIVRGEIRGRRFIKVIDATTGEYLGEGVVPPYVGYSLRGPNNTVCQEENGWSDFTSSAQDWFDDFTRITFGDEDTVSGVFPSENTIRAQIEDPSTSYFYELAHGHSTSFHSGCSDDTTATEVDDWMEDRNKMLFAFIASCKGMCSNTDDTFSYEFRKGSSVETTAVGYCNMDESWCDSCWDDALSWQNNLFFRIGIGSSVYNAWVDALTDYPSCLSCMRFDGDTDFSLKEYIYNFVDSETVGIGASRNYTATKSIHVADYGRPYIIDGNGSSGGQVTMSSEGVIEFYPGFEARPGASMVAIVE